MFKFRNANGSHDGFAFWRLVTWLLLLLSAYGCLTYFMHAGQVWKVAQTLPAGNPQDLTQLHVMLAWDVGYFVVAFALVVICAGAILRQAWARPSLQVASLLLAVVAFVGGLTQAASWRSFSQAVKATDAQTSLDTASEMALTHLHRSFLMAMGIRALAIPLLLWLAWSLGRPLVRSQFHARRR